MKEPMPRRTGRKTNRARVLGGVLAAACLLGAVAIAPAAEPEEAQYNAVAALSNAGQWQAALKKIDERLRLPLADPMRAKYLYARGLALEKGGQSADAARTYAELLEKFPKAPEAGPARAALLYVDYGAGRNENVVRAYEALDKNALAADDRRNVHLMAAEAYYARDEFDKALPAYQAALALGADRQAIAAKLFDLYLRGQKHADLVALTAAGLAGVKPELLALARAESLTALGRPAEAETEAAKVPAGHALYPRACFVRAQALIKAGKLKEAVAPLEIAVRDLRDPPAPPSASLALAECLLEAGRAADAEQAVARAEKALGSLPEADRPALQQQIAAARLRAVSRGGDRRKLIRAIDAARDTIPREQLGQALYLRLHALGEEEDTAGILASLKTDAAILQAGAEDGPATLIFFRALKKARRVEEGEALLDGFLKRKATGPEAAQARLELARAAMDRGEREKALGLLTALTAAAGAREALGAELFADAQYNQAVMAFQLGRPDAAIAVLDALVAGRPGTNALVRALVLSGQAWAAKTNYANAARQWTAALAAGPVEEEAGLREQLGRALSGARDAAGADAQFTVAARLRGRQALAPESQAAWARALYGLKRYDEAAAKFQALHRETGTAEYAYEAGVAFEHAGKKAEAETWYGTAQKRRDTLPADYAREVDAAVARLRAESGTGDLGMGYWLDCLATGRQEDVFLGAVQALRKLAEPDKPAARAADGVARAAEAYTPQQPRYYLLGALRVQLLAAAARDAAAREAAESLLRSFAENEKGLDPKSPGATLAPAMLYYYKGETERRRGQHADALAAFETVLAAYPYNEWPDAAACGAADCYAALGDTNTALTKLQEVVKLSAAAPASARWVEYAGKRIEQIRQGGK